jgi:hypothetical protein
MYEFPRPDKHGSIGGTFPIFSCGPANGEATDSRALAKGLATTAAGPHPFSAVNANWLLLAYARLRRLYKLPEYAEDLGRAMALARGLTAYISTHKRSPVHPGGFSCEQGSDPPPRDALNIFIRQT